MCSVQHLHSHEKSERANLEKVLGTRDPSLALSRANQLKLREQWTRSGSEIDENWQAGLAAASRSQPRESRQQFQSNFEFEVSVSNREREGAASEDLLVTIRIPSCLAFSSSITDYLCSTFKLPFNPLFEVIGRPNSFSSPPDTHTTLNLSNNQP